jgi:hypothetical protein
MVKMPFANKPNFIRQSNLLTGLYRTRHRTDDLLNKIDCCVSLVNRFAVAIYFCNSMGGPYMKMLLSDIVRVGLWVISLLLNLPNSERWDRKGELQCATVTGKLTSSKSYIKLVACKCSERLFHWINYIRHWAQFHSDKRVCPKELCSHV